MSLLATLKEQFNKRLYEESVVRIEKVLHMLSEDEIWHSPNEHANSIGNLILHLCGNVTQWIGTGIGGLPDIRERDLEFNTTKIYSKEFLINKLYGLKNTTDEALGSLKDDDILLEARQVQGYDETVLSILIHVIEHFSYHTGQIAVIAKYLKAQDLGFYEGVDLNVKS